MTYITAANLLSAMGTGDYNKTLSLEGSATADSATVTWVLNRADARIDMYRTQMTTAEKVELAYDIAKYYAYSRRGPQGVPGPIWEDFGRAIEHLKMRTGIRVRPTYVPEEKQDQDLLDDQTLDPT